MWLLLALACQQPVPARSAPDLPAAKTLRTFTVDCNGGAHYTEIGDAIKDARSGDRILVAPCTYNETIRFKGRSVRVESTGGAAVTTIVADPGEPVIEVDDGETVGTVIAGFTLTGGGGLDQPAIEVQFSSLTLRDDVVTGNGGNVTLYSVTGHVVVERTTFEDNTPSEGMVIQERRGMTVLKDSVVRCGTAEIGHITEHGAAFIDGSTFDCPGAVAVEVFNADGRIERSVLDGRLHIQNELLEVMEKAVVEDVILRGGATVDEAAVTFRNSVMLAPLVLTDANVKVEGSILTDSSCAIDATRSTVTVRYSDVWGNTRDACGDLTDVTGEGVIAADPKFVDAAAGDFRLKSTSPGVDAGPPGFGYADPDGSPNDMGAHGGPLSIGGGW